MPDYEGEDYANGWNAYVDGDLLDHSKSFDWQDGWLDADDEDATVYYEDQ